MTQKKTVSVVRKFLKKTQDWVDKTPGVISVSVDIGHRTVVLAQKNREKRLSASRSALVPLTQKKRKSKRA